MPRAAVRRVSLLSFLALGAASATALADRPDRDPPRALPPPPPQGAPCPAGYVRVPAGTFTMGSPDGEGLPQEHPQRKVTLAAFCMHKTEVTAAAYAACVTAGGCTDASEVRWPRIADAERARFSALCNAGKPDRGDHPINCVDWDQADAYCKWSGAHLPSEEQWEYAARGTDGRVYPWGNDPPTAGHVNACGAECERDLRPKLADTTPWRAAYAGDDGFAETAPVGSFPQGASPFGVQDLAGNVVEWTATPYCLGATCTPQLRIFRGSAFTTHDSTPSLLRAARRKQIDATLRFHDTGFRCAR